MIFDTVENLAVYKGIYPNLDIAVDYLLTHDLSKINLGHYDILDNKVYMNVIDGKLLEEAESSFELHQQYLDLHIDIEGREKIKFAKYDEKNIIKQYDKEGDYALMQGTENASCELDKNHFAICMLGEPHMPCLKIDCETHVKKAILKVLVDTDGI